MACIIMDGMGGTDSIGGIVGMADMAANSRQEKLEVDAKADQLLGLTIAMRPNMFLL